VRELRKRLAKAFWDAFLWTLIACAIGVYGGWQYNRGFDEGARAHAGRSPSSTHRGQAGEGE
jgi:hypothetical protein